MSKHGTYIGRFAPSPSGPLHFGSMVAALGSYLDARHYRGQWLLRIEDVDRPRVVPGAEDAIFRTLETFGLEWDGAVVCQRDREQAYAAALSRLKEGARVFACACSRREIADSVLARDGSHRYPGTCRNGLPPGRTARAWRFRATPGEVCFDDSLQGRICEDVDADVGDFVLFRADGLFAYQLAVVVDDADAGVTHVARGADLIDSTCRQILLQRALGFPTPQYMHFPVVVNAAGEKLSKQTLAAAVDTLPPADVMFRCLAFLGQCPPPELARAGVATIRQWAIENWNRRLVPRQRTGLAPGEQREYV
ncbi:MAG: tRNA glutamyl-Q(34) synthetase GluQRS [Rhodocyclaceae bacterium]|nr:tRNA glutamyl-Q(34) synthetase GluQRS [Rhodocyclaceae bacterium]